MSMLKKTCLFLFVVPFFVSSQTPVASYIAPLASQSLLLDIQITETGIIAVGERGHVLFSENGENWQQQRVASLATLTGIETVAGNIWLVGHDATILHSQDEGQTWTLQYFAPELEKPLLDVAFFDELNGIAVGAYGLFLRTQDGGKKWTAEVHTELLNPDDMDYLEELKSEDPEFYKQELGAILPHLNRLSRSGDILYLAGEAGLLAFSEDQGKNWQRMQVDYAGSFFDIKKTLAGDLIAVGLRGNIFAYQQASLSWQALASGTTSTLNSIVNIDPTHSMIVGNNGAVVWLTAQKTEFKQTDDSKTITNAVVLGNRIIATSEVGIKTLANKGQ